MGEAPRKHHYVPVFHLARFTADGTKEGRLHVFDQRGGPPRTDKPRNVGHRRDWNRHDGAKDPATGEELDPFFVERDLGQRLEGQAARVCRTVEVDGVPPSGPDRDILLNYVALQLVRTPEARKRTDKYMSDEHRRKFKKALLDDNEWDLIRADLESADEPIDIDRAKLVESCDDDSIQMNLDRTTLVAAMLHQQRSLLGPLSIRTWCVRWVEPKAPDLILSDKPVGFAFLPGAPSGEHRYIFSEHIALILPLSPRALLWSEIAEIVYAPSLGEEEVAVANSAALWSASEAYSRSSDFVWRARSGRMGAREWMGL